MADLDTAVEFMLRLEDSTLAGVITDIPGDSGGRTRFGVAERFHPDLTKTGFYDTMNQPDALRLAKLIYRTQYCASLRLDQFKDQNIANCMLSFAVNEGVIEAVKIFQRALKLPPDGIIGSQTLDKANSVKAEDVMLAIYQQQKAFYIDLVEKDPTKQKFLNGWINRVKTSTTINYPESAHNFTITV